MIPKMRRYHGFCISIVFFIVNSQMVACRRLRRKVEDRLWKTDNSDNRVLSSEFTSNRKLVYINATKSILEHINADASHQFSSRRMNTNETQYDDDYEPYGDFVEQSENAPLKTLQQILNESYQFSRFTTALSSSGITLTNNITVFAPRYYAFDLWDGFYWKKLISPPYVAHLQNLVKFHIYNKNVYQSIDLTDGLVLRMNNKEDVTVKIIRNNTGSTVTEQITLQFQPKVRTKIVRTDLIASNGVIHVIDKVFIPNFFERSLLKVVKKTQNKITTFAKIVALVPNVVDIMRYRYDYTILAPTDAAFSRIPKESLDLLLSDTKKAATWLSNHIIPQVVSRVALSKSKTLTTTGGQTILVTQNRTKIFLQGVGVKSYNLLAFNGILHTINGVIFV